MEAFYLIVGKIFFWGIIASVVLVAISSFARWRINKIQERERARILKETKTNVEEERNRYL
jgi:hypothetical protein